MGLSGFRIKLSETQAERNAVAYIKLHFASQAYRRVFYFGNIIIMKELPEGCGTAGVRFLKGFSVCGILRESQLTMQIGI